MCRHLGKAFEAEETISAKAPRQRAPGMLGEQEAGRRAWNRMNDGKAVGDHRGSYGESRMHREVHEALAVCSESRKFWRSWKKGRGLTRISEDWSSHCEFSISVPFTLRLQGVGTWLRGNYLRNSPSMGLMKSIYGITVTPAPSGP